MADPVRRDWRKTRRSERIERHTTELVADPSVVTAIDELKAINAELRRRLDEMQHHPRIDHIEQCVAQLGADMVSSINALNAKIDHEIETHDHRIEAKLDGDKIIIGGRAA